MNQHIHCLVDNCHYWSNGNKCQANEIIVTSDQFGDSNPDKIDAKMAMQLSTTPADTCMETCCKTFVPRGTDKNMLDSINKMS